ncbi:hypothetical protein [Novosphingobium sp. BL-52-GroH]|uniref:hypothetical protein n=1 Tax=Novosphingobium sp. BL-52-GroH TaxID=3349877 RepID=UPI00384B5DA5
MTEWAYAVHREGIRQLRHMCAREGYAAATARACARRRMAKRPTPTFARNYIKVPPERQEKHGHEPESNKPIKLFYYRRLIICQTNKSIR